MGRSADDTPPATVEGLEGASLLDAMTMAGAAVDKAQVAGDVAAHRVVQVVAGCADGIPPIITDVIAPPAVESERIAADVADAAARYEQARDRHARTIEHLAKAPAPEALEELRGVATDSARAEADAIDLLERIDAAEERLERRAAMTTPGLKVVPADPATVPRPPHMH